MADLRSLEIERGWTYETLVSTYRAGSPHATPIGVWTPDFSTVEMEIYNDSKTLDGILAAKEFTIGFPRGAEEIHAALLHPDSLIFTPARLIDAPEPAGLCAVLEVRVVATTPGTRRTRVAAGVIDLRTDGPFRPLNRAAPLLLEALVLHTRADLMDRATLRRQLLEYARVITKVAPGSPYEAAVRELIEPLAPHGGSASRD